MSKEVEDGVELDYAHIASIGLKCFRYFRRMLQVFHTDVAKVDIDVTIHAYALHAVSVFVDTKINTLDSEGKCSPSFEKSTKRASQFDMQLTWDKQKLNLRAYRLEFRISLTQIVSASSADREIKNKRILNAGAE